MPEQRAAVHCGWLPRDEWTEPYEMIGVVVGQGAWTHDTCPGYLLAQPQMKEAVAAFDARKNQCLPLYFPGLQKPVLEAARVLGAAFSRWEAEQTKKRET